MAQPLLFPRNWPNPRRPPSARRRHVNLRGRFLGLFSFFWGYTNDVFPLDVVRLFNLPRAPPLELFFLNSKQVSPAISVTLRHFCDLPFEVRGTSTLEHKDQVLLDISSPPLKEAKALIQSRHPWV